TLKSKNTCLVIIDMINGFTREGTLKSPRIEAIIPQIADLSLAAHKAGMTRIAFADCHTDKSFEFESYPVHCKAGSSESEIVDELKEIKGYHLFNKNSTNGFLEPEFEKWLLQNEDLDTFIITGDCTDICVMQFAVSIKTWFNLNDRKSRVIVPLNAVETYDLGIHNADLMNMFALNSMIGNGIEVVSEIIL
ncbi:MAG TPA: isochorismatase family cysteine hydrolase, partial [Clostridia bacterium]